LAQCYEYTVSVDLSTASSTVSIDNSSKSASVKVLHRIDYLNQKPYEPVEFPAQSDLRFWFDFSDPACFDGVSSSFNDLSGNGNNGQIIDAATGSALASAEGLVKTTNQGTAISLPYQDGKALRWGAPSDVPSSFTGVLVAVSNHRPEDIIGLVEDGVGAPEDIQTVQLESAGAEFMTRGGGGVRFGTHYELNTYRDRVTSYSYPPDGVFDRPNQLGLQFLRQLCTTFGVDDIYTYATNYYNAYPDAGSNPNLVPFLNGYLNLNSYVNKYLYPDGETGVSGGTRWMYSDRHAGLGSGDVQIISFSVDDTVVSNYLNGQEISNQSVRSGRNPSSSNVWHAGIVVNNDGTLRLNSNAGGQFYAMAFYEKALSAEEHRQVYDYYNRATIRPSFPYKLGLPPSVQVRTEVSEGDVFYTSGIYEGLQYGIQGGGRQKAEILIDPSLASVAQDISIDASAKTSSVSIDNSSHEVDALVCPLGPLNPFTFEINTTNLTYDNYDYYKRPGVLTNAVAENNVPSVIATFPSATPSSGANVISSASNQYTLPTVEGGDYNFKVFWGDGNEDYITEWNDPKITHTYQDSGAFVIRIDGVFSGMNFHFNKHTGHREGAKLINIMDWGNAALDLCSFVRVPRPDGSTSSLGVFADCPNWIMTATEPPKFEVTAERTNPTIKGQLQPGFSTETGREFPGSNLPGGVFTGCVNLQGDFTKWGTSQAPLQGSLYNQMRRMWNATPNFGFEMHFGSNQYLAFSQSSIVNADGTAIQGSCPANFEITNWKPHPNLIDTRTVQYQTMFGSMDNFNPSDVSAFVTDKVTSLRATFPGLNSWTGGGVENWDTSSVVSFNSAFQQCDSFNVPVHMWVINTDNPDGVDMASMFYGCDIFNQRVDTWDFTNVITTNRIFRDASEYNNGGHSWTSENWARNASMSEMFRSTSFNQDVSEWIMPSVSFAAGGLFYGTPFNNPVDTHTDDQGQTYWDMSNCTSIINMFAKDVDFNQPLNNWDTSQVTNMSLTFEGAYSFNQDLSNWDVSNVTTFDRMFQNARSFNGEVGTWTINTNEPVRMFGMFYNCPHLFDGQNGRGGDLSGWDTSQVNSMAQMFYNSSQFRRSYWGEEDPSVLSYTHTNGVNYVPDWSPGVGGWDTGNVTSFSNMFFQAGTFNEDISGWNVSKSTSFARFLKSCFKFDRDLSSWSLNTDPSANVSLHEMFMNCVVFNNGGSAGIDNWDTSRVVNMGEMFRACQAFNQPIGSWDTSNVTDMQFMFTGANAFNQDIGNWDTSSVTNMINMFLSADAFNQDLSSWDLSSVTNIASMFDGTAMSKANLDTTIQGWCANANTPSGLSIGKIPLNGTTELLDSATISAMTAKGMTGTYSNGSAIY